MGLATYHAETRTSSYFKVFVFICVFVFVFVFVFGDDDAPLTMLRLAHRHISKCDDDDDDDEIPSYFDPHFRACSHLKSPKTFCIVAMMLNI